MKLAFICDWLTGMRGGERCLEAVCKLYPDADIFTLVHIPGTVSGTIESHKIYTSYIQRLPGNIETFRRYLLLFPNAIERFDLSGYDCILSFSHCVAKGVKTPAGVPHICYCHTPMRYAWRMRNEYLNGFGYLKKKLAGCMLDYLRWWDKKSSSRVTQFIANSKNVQSRIKEAYNRDSTVIYPPVECSRFDISEDDDGYYLVISALVPYKRIDIAVEAFGADGRRLVIVGNGPELSRLKSIASANVVFIEKADDNEVVEYMKKCRALLFPGEEDFGIVPLEAQACGKPVMAFGKGGALETIIGLEQSSRKEVSPTGIFFFQQNPAAILEAVSLFEKKRDRFDTESCRSNALRFDRPVFMKALQDYIDGTIVASNNGC